MAINKAGLNWNHLTPRQVHEEAWVAQPWGKVLWPFWGVGMLGASPKCLDTSLHSMGIRQEELEVYAGAELRLRWDRRYVVGQL